MLLGIAINKTLDFLSDRKRIKRAGKRWGAEIRSLELPLKNQIKYLDSFLEKHNKESFARPNLAISSVLNCEVFKSLDKSDLLRYIEIDSKIPYEQVVKNSNRTHGYISVLIHLHETLKTKFSNYLSETSNHINSFTKSLQSLLIAFVDYGVSLESELKVDPIDDPSYKPIFDLFSTHILPKMEKGDFNVFELREIFFSPLLHLLSQNRLDDRIRPLSIFVSSCLNDIKGIEMENIYLTESMTHIKEQPKLTTNKI